MSYLTEEEQREKDKEERRRTSRQQIIEHARKPLMFTAFDAKWIPVSASIVAVGHYPNNQGAISVFKLADGELQTTCELKKPLPLKCCTFGHSPAELRHLATGDFQGNLQIWDAEKGLDAAEPLGQAKKAHDSIINAIDGALHDGPPEICTGSRDGTVKVWDARQLNKAVVALNPADKGRARDCWTVKFGGSTGPDDRMVAAGYDNGDVKLFDLRTRKMLHEFNCSNGVCDLEFDRQDVEINKLIVSSLEGRIRAYDLRTLHPTLGYAYVEDRVSSGTIWATKALPQNRDVFMSGGAGELTLHRYLYPPERSVGDEHGVKKGVAGTIDELNKAKLGEQPINAVDWNKHREGLLCCAGFDQTIRVMIVTKLGGL